MRKIRYSIWPAWRGHIAQVATCLCLVTGNVYPLMAQTAQKITINQNKTSVRTLLNTISKQSGMYFMYDESTIKGKQDISLHCKDATLEEVLKQICNKLGLKYEIDKKTIILLPMEKTPKKTIKEEDKRITVSGYIYDENGEAMPGANLRLKGNDSQEGTISDIDGHYSLSFIPQPNMKIMVSFIGYATLEDACPTKTATKDFHLKKNESEIEEVVVTGMFTRRAESFTGSSKTYRKEELFRNGNQNLLKSLSNIDPSFQIVENMDLGSNPNSLPEIQLRGENSFPNLEGDYSGNPNQPLFILDGFETTIEKVYDLDMNRVASVTLLKDAAAKAIYGSKAGNGVVVIETIRPQTGELRVSYSGNLDVEIPDLTGYNLMNSREKLSFEKAHGMYDVAGGTINEIQNMDKLYQQILTDVMSGVDTYWLSKPLRVGVGQKHSLNLEGGDDRMRYSAGLSYNDIEGVMKGSDRQTINVNVTLSYSYKNLIFRNSLEFTRNTANESPYGAFSDYVRLNPYWKPVDETGHPQVLLGTIKNNKYYNPLYNATLNTKNESGYTEVLDNFNVDWKISDAFRAVGKFSYSRNLNSSDLFYPASHTMFATYDDEGFSDRKGKYTKSNGVSEYIQADFGVNFNKTFAEKHLIFANVNFNMSSNTIESTSFTAEGFGNDQMDDISFATQYETNGTPSGEDETRREVGITTALNYSYNDRYLLDFSYRANASSIYGADNRWGGFWSVGAGWNIHNEEYVRDKMTWINLLKLRGSMGYTGTQNFNPYQARANYKFGNISYDGKFGASLMGLPNPALQWQKNMDYNVGFDAAFANRNINITFDYYISRTENLLTDISVPPSLGFTTYKENLGEIENRGLDLSVSVTPWRDDKNRGWLTLSVSALHNTNKIKKIYDIFSTSNDKQNEEKNEGSNIVTGNVTDYEKLKEQYTRPSTLYYEGQSMSAIWGVRSAGIDPMTGEEMFYDKNGQLTSIWSSEDQVVIGDTNPKVRGNINISAGYKGFTFSLACNYKWGGDLYNTTLVDKVENATGWDNLDKRILNSWTHPGQDAPYKKLVINSTDSRNLTKPTSRFIQKDNELYISTISIGYDFYEQNFLRKLGIERLRCSLYANELLRLSSVKTERGYSYPFSRNLSFTLQATF